MVDFPPKPGDYRHMLGGILRVDKVFTAIAIGWDHVTVHWVGHREESWAISRTEWNQDWAPNLKPLRKR